MRITSVALVLLVCVGIGFLAGRLTAPSASARRAGERREAPRDVVPEPRRPKAEPLRPAHAQLDNSGGPFMEAEVARRAAEIRERAQLMAAQAEEAARLQVKREIARERALLEDAARGGALALLRGLKQDWTPPWELLSSPERYGALTARKTRGGAVDGTRIDSDTVLRDGDAVQFPPGRCSLDWKWIGRLDPFPKDLAIEGRGMDDTLLNLSSELETRGEVHSLTFRDLTLHCNDNYLERLRREPYTLRLERCRVIGFDMGAGGSCMLGGRAGAFYAVDCRIEAGFGRAPGSGEVFKVRGAFLARLERCTIVGPFRSVYYRGSQAAQLFVDCRFEQMPATIRSHLEEHAAAVRFLNCTFEYLPEDAPTRPPQRLLKDINPAWVE